MNPRLILLLACAMAHTVLAADVKVAPAPTAPAAANATPARATTPAAPRPDSSITPTATFDAFRLVTDRNIFNPNRTGRRDRTNEEAPPRLDVISLVGTMDSERGPRAFFDGSTTAFRKTLRVGESVDAFKVVKISPNLVQLERDGKTVAVIVGQQLRRPEGGDWNVTEAQPAPRATTMGDPSRVDPNAPPVIPANADDVTRRMMERRAKQLKQ